MKDSQILSAFPQADPLGSRPTPTKVEVFNACNVGVVLRAVLFVQAVVSVEAMFGAANLADWLTRLAVITGGALPATLAWLVVACVLKKLLARLSEVGQAVSAVVLGVLAGLYGCGVLTMFGSGGQAPWLASSFAGALGAAALLAGLRLRAKGRMPAGTAARLYELQSRIRPHFLFNTLNSAIALVRAEPAKAETMLEDLSDLFRYALVDHGDAASLGDEIALARRYLAIEQVRFGERLRVEWQLDPHVNKARLPPLVLQPLVENAVRHGVEPSDSGAQIRVSTEKRGSVAVIKVTNSLPAGPGPQGHGVALENVRDRLSLLHDVQAQFRSGMKDGIYQVRIEVPL